MKQILICGTLVLLAGSLFAADSDDVKNAAKKLADQGNYSWKTTVDMGGGGRGFGGPIEGKLAKDGVEMISMTTGQGTTEAYLKGEKGVLKSQDGDWQTLDELAAAGQGGGRGGFMAMRLRNLKAPAVEAQDLVSKAKEIKKDGDAYGGDLTEDGAKSLMTFGGRRGGGPPPTISNAKGSVKLWVKDGVLAKYEIKVAGSMDFNGNNMDIDRTTTVEIKDVGSTKVTVPEEATKKLQ